MAPRFHPVLIQPDWREVLDLSLPLDQQAVPDTPWTLGRYDERRTIYVQPLFAEGRTVHMGIDLGGPIGAAVHAFFAGVVVHSGSNPADGDYGGTVVTEHELPEGTIWALHGHLSHASIEWSPAGRNFKSGEVLGWLGDARENGGWPPHVHFQLSRRRPETHDLPGAVTPAERSSARECFPDPRLVLGPLY